MGRGNVRGLARELLNSDFMRLKNYEVIDNPEIMLSDGLNLNKRPDHRIDGTIYDSYAPKLTVTDWDDFYVDPAPESEFDLMEKTLSDLPEVLREAWRDIQREHIVKGIGEKVNSGQTRNILLNLSDTSDSGQVLSNEALAGMFNRMKNLEKVVCIYEKKGSPFRGETRGKGEIWSNHLPTDMEAVQWTKGSTGFAPLPDGAAGTGGTGSEGGSSGGEAVTGSSGAGAGITGVGAGMTGAGAGITGAGAGTTGAGAGITGAGAGIIGAGAGTTGAGAGAGAGITGAGAGAGAGAVAGIAGEHSVIGTLLASLGVVAAIGGIVALLTWLLPSNASKSHQKTTKASKAAVEMYRKQMSQVVNSKTSKPETVAAAHNDMKIAVLKLIPTSIPDHGAVTRELEEILEVEHQTLVVDKQVYAFFDNNFITPYFTTVVLFIYLVSRSVDTLVTIATQKACLQNRILGTHVGLMTFCLIGERLLQLVFLGILSWPLKLILSACVVSMVIWLLHEFTGYCTHAASGVTYFCQVLWGNTEIDQMQTKLTLPKRAAVAMATITVLHVSTRCFKSISIASALFKIPSQVFTPFIVFVKVFGYVGFLAKVAWVMSLVMLVLLLILALEMALPCRDVTQQITKYMNMAYNGISVGSLLDTLWKETEKFIDSRPDAVKQM